MPTPEPKPVRERLIHALDPLVALLLAAAGVTLALRGLAHAGAEIPVGPDAGLWGLEALDRAVGREATMPPAFPAAVAALGGAASALKLSPALAGLVPGVIHAAVRAAGGSRAGALLAGGFALASPDLYGLALQLQPDAMTALAFATGLLALAIYAARPGLVPLLGLVASAAFATFSREHGAIVALAAAALTAGWPPVGARGPAGRLIGPALIGITLLTLPWGLGWTQDPLSWPWTDKSSVPLLDWEAVWHAPQVHPPSFWSPTGAEDAGPGVSVARAEEVLAAYPQVVGDRDRSARALGMLALNARWAWAVGGDLQGAGWLAVGAILLWARRRPALVALAAPWAATLPLWLIWSQRRHVSVLLPVVWVGLGLAWSLLEERLRARLPRLGRAPLAAPLLALLAVGGRQVDTLPERAAWLGDLSEEAMKYRPIWRAGLALGARAEASDWLCSELSLQAALAHLQLAARLPFAPVDRQVLASPPERLSPVWRCHVAVSDREGSGARPASGWTRSATASYVTLYRYKPNLRGDQRACQAGDAVWEPRFRTDQARAPEIAPREGCP